MLIDRPPGPPRFLLALTHGAGGGVGTPDLLAARDAALELGGAVARILQPYQVRGARSPGSPDRQDAAWISVLAAVREMLGETTAGRAKAGRGGAARDGAGRDGSGRDGAGRDGAGRVPLVQGGRSNGARVACRTAGQAGAGAVIALAFPLHPPGRPERSRRDELRLAIAAGADVLVVNGSRDPFGVPRTSDASSAGAGAAADGGPVGGRRRGSGSGGPDGGGPGGTARIVVLEGETHALSKNPAAVGAAVSSWLSAWLGTAAASRLRQRCGAVRRRWRWASAAGRWLVRAGLHRWAGAGR